MNQRWRHYGPLRMEPLRDRTYDQLYGELESRNSQHATTIEKFLHTRKKNLKKQLEKTCLPLLSRLRTEPGGKENRVHQPLLKVQSKTELRRTTRRLERVAANNVLLGIVNIRLDVGKTKKQTLADWEQAESSYRRRANFRSKQHFRPSKELRIFRQADAVYSDDWNLMSINALPLPKSERVHL